MSESKVENKRLAAAIEAVETAQRALVALKRDLARRVTDPLFAQAEELFADGWRYTFYEGYWQPDGDLAGWVEEEDTLTWRGWEVDRTQLPAALRGRKMRKRRAKVLRYLLDLTAEGDRSDGWAEERLHQIALDHACSIHGAWLGRYKIDGHFYPSPSVEVVMESVVRRVLRIVVDPGEPGYRKTPVPPEELMALVVELKGQLEAFGYQVVIEQKGEEE